MPSNILPFIALAFIATQVLIIRYLSIDPGFKIKTRAAGELCMCFAFGPRDVCYGDIDHLGKINDALTDPVRGVTGHDRFNQLMRLAIAQTRRADVALVYGGDELRWLVRSGTGLGFCHRLQQVLRDVPLSDQERTRLLAATGVPYISITLAYEPSRGVLSHRTALNVVKVRVQGVKPKCGPGRRGEVIAA